MSARRTESETRWIWASAAAAGHRYLQQVSGGRHVLGLGLGGPLSNGPAPLEVMRTYLDDFEIFDNYLVTI